MREQKESVRKILRQRKEAMVPEDRLSKSHRICRHLMNVISNGETVMVFTSKEKEVNTRPLIMALFKQGNPVVVPIIVKADCSLRLSYLRDFSALVPSTFGVPEPIGSEIPAAAKDTGTGEGSGTAPVIMTGSSQKIQTCGRSGSHLPARNSKACQLTRMISGWIISSPRMASYIRTGGYAMEINGTPILDTFAEAFPVWLSRVIITAATPEWAEKAAAEATGFATSKIGCPCEAGIERSLSPDETPDGRAGVSILICADKKNMKSNVAARIAQCILPAPTASAYDGFPDAASRFYIRMHYFGDRYEERCVVGGRRCWRIPVMEGDYIGEERFGTVKGIAGGNFLVMGKDQRSALSGAEAAMKKITGMPGVLTGFAGGIVASGSKVGCSNYRFPMPASTNHLFCPTLKGRIRDSLVPDGVSSIYEIVLNGVDESSVKNAMRTGIQAATGTGTVMYIGASNFDGKLGQYRFALHDLFR